MDCPSNLCVELSINIFYSTVISIQGENMLVKCNCCSKKFNKSLAQIKYTKNNYCSRSCAAKINNKIPKRKKEKKYFCKICFIEVPYRRVVCEKHNKNKIDWGSVTKEQMIDLRKYQTHSRIRTLARKLYLKSDKSKFCINCKYDKHFDVCHIKAIEDFDLSITIAEINDLDNLIALCKNCHWEQHNGLLQIGTP